MCVGGGGGGGGEKGKKKKATRSTALFDAEVSKSLIIINYCAIKSLMDHRTWREMVYRVCRVILWLMVTLVLRSAFPPLPCRAVLTFSASQDTALPRLFAHTWSQRAHCPALGYRIAGSLSTDRCRRAVVPRD